MHEEIGRDWETYKVYVRESQVSVARKPCLQQALPKSMQHQAVSMETEMHKNVTSEHH